MKEKYAHTHTHVQEKKVNQMSQRSEENLFTTTSNKMVHNTQPLCICLRALSSVGSII